MRDSLVSSTQQASTSASTSTSCPSASTRLQVPVLGKQVQVQAPVPTELVSPNLIFSSLTVWFCRLYKQENLSQNLFAAIRKFHRCSSLIKSPQKYCTSVTDSKRLYPNNLRKQSFQHTPRSLILATGRFRAPMQ